MLCHFFSEKLLPNAQPEQLLVQFEAIFPCPVTSCRGEEATPHLDTTFMSFGISIHWIPNKTSLNITEIFLSCSCISTALW